MASKTAQMIAAYRARASASDAPLVSDPWAGSLAGPEGVELARAWDAIYAHMTLWVALRTATIEVVLEAMDPAQVVLLGAGLDTRAARHGRSGRRFFEVDMPTTQALKIERLRQLDGYPMEAATFVSCDFETQSYLERLVEEGLDVEVPTFFILEGVAPYLTERALRDTLDPIPGGCHPDSVLIFDHVDEAFVAGTSRYRDQQEIAELVGEVGEPFRWGSAEPGPLLREHGFEDIWTTTFDHLCRELTGTHDRKRGFHHQWMTVCSAGTLLLPPGWRAAQGGGAKT